MSQRPNEISNIIKQQLKSYKEKVELTETGTVILVGDGIARVYGLRNCMAGELLEFDDGSTGMAKLFLHIRGIPVDDLCREPIVLEIEW